MQNLPERKREGAPGVEGANRPAGARGRLGTCAGAAVKNMMPAMQLSADLIQRRDDMRLLLGENYAAHVSEARAVLRGVAAEDDVSLFEAALGIAHNMAGDGYDPSIILAALVDESEASR